MCAYVNRAVADTHTARIRVRAYICSGACGVLCMSAGGERGAGLRVCGGPGPAGPGQRGRGHDWTRGYGCRIAMRAGAARGAGLAGAPGGLPSNLSSVLGSMTSTVFSSLVIARPQDVGAGVERPLLLRATLYGKAMLTVRAGQPIDTGIEQSFIVKRFFFYFDRFVNHFDVRMSIAECKVCEIA